MNDTNATPPRGLDSDATPPHGTILDESPEEAIEQAPDETGDDAPADMARRQLMLRLLIGGGAALALGGGTAVLLNRNRRVVIVPGGGQAPGVAPGVPSARLADLEAELAAVMAERDQLISDLAEAQAEISRLNAELDQASAERDHLQELNSLWEALDDVGLDDIVATGLSAVAGVLSPVLALVALVLNGLRLARNVLGDFEDDFPTPQAGIAWLKERFLELASDLEWLAKQVQEAVEPVEQFATQILNFVLFVLDKLPFGAGKQARAGLEAMQTVLAGLPDMITGVNDSVLDPLGSWFGEDEDRTLIATLVEPLTDELVGPTETLTTRVASLDSTFQDDLSKPAEDALEKRAEIRARIDALVAHGKMMGLA